jgi:hypothetical protein
MYLAISDGTTTYQLLPASSLSPFSLAREGYALQLAPLQLAPLNAQDRYAPVEETLTIHVSGGSQAEVLANVETLRVMCDQAALWERGQAASAVRLIAQADAGQEGEAVTYECALLAAEIAPTALASSGLGDSRAGWARAVEVRIRRRGVWQAEVDGNNPSVTPAPELPGPFDIEMEDGEQRIPSPTWLLLDPSFEGLYDALTTSAHTSTIILANAPTDAILLNAAFSSNVGPSSPSSLTAIPANDSYYTDGGVARWATTILDELPWASYTVHPLPGGISMNGAMNVYLVVWNRSTTCAFTVRVGPSNPPGTDGTWVVDPQDTSITGPGGNCPQVIGPIPISIPATAGTYITNTPVLTHLRIQVHPSLNNIAHQFDIDQIVVCRADDRVQVLTISPAADMDDGTHDQISINPVQTTIPVPAVTTSDGPLTYSGSAALATTGATIRVIWLAPDANGYWRPLTTGAAPAQGVVYAIRPGVALVPRD